MKYDCYPRFLRSVIYRQCVTALENDELPSIPEVTLNDPDLNIDYVVGDPDDPNSLNYNLMALKKSESDAGERRRRSLLPWPKKDRSKSKVSFIHLWFVPIMQIRSNKFFVESWSKNLLQVGCISLLQTPSFYFIVFPLLILVIIWKSQITD